MRDAAHSDKDHDRYLEDRDKAQRQAALQLKRVCSQLADALMPINCHLNVANNLQINLQWELKLPIADMWQRHKQFSSPLALWPHLEVWFFDASSSEAMKLWSTSALEAYGPDDLAALAANARGGPLPRPCPSAASDILGISPVLCRGRV